MEKSILSSAPTPYVLALIRAIERGPRRPHPEKHLAWYLDMDAPPHIHALLAAWASHAVSQLRIGSFVMDDQAIQKSFGLPVWRKDGRGPHADVERVWGQYRDDVLVLGTARRSDGVTWIVGIERYGSTIRDVVIEIDGPYNSSCGTLDSFLRFHHQDGEPSALDPLT